MSEIVKTKAICTRKIDYGDSSKIVTLYSPDFGKFSAIIKAGRSSKSQIGSIVDVFNYIDIVFYKKENRSIQLITQAELVNFYKHIKSDISIYKYASSVLELINEIVHENESNPLLFRGLVRIFELLEENTKNPKETFIKFLFFFIKELGYEINTKICSVCESELTGSENSHFDLNNGVICSDCLHVYNTHPTYSKELFKNIICLTSIKNNYSIEDKNLDSILNYLLRYLKKNIPEFSGLKSLLIY